MANIQELPDIARVVGKYLQGSGRNVPYIDYSVKIQEFLAWYRGKTKWHKYSVYNGENYLDVERYALCMAKTVCEDLASLEINEKLKITLEDEKANSFIKDMLELNNFQVQANELMEIKHALGGAAFVAGIGEDMLPKIHYIHGDMVFPLSWENGQINECAFVQIGGNNKITEYTLIMHIKNEFGFYEIREVEVDSDGKVVMPNEIAGEIERQYNEAGEKVYVTNSKIAWFQYVKPAIVNNYDKTSPLGIAAFGNSIDILKSIDNIYDSWHNEFVLGKKRIFVKTDLKRIVVNPSKGVTNQIDPHDTMFYQLDWTGKDNDKPPIYESQMTLRTQEHIDSLNAQLNLLSRKSGLGENYYSFLNGSVAVTATQVVSSNSSLFRNLKKNNKLNKKAIKGIIRALLEIGSAIGLGSYDIMQDIAIEFDDGVIEDTTTKRTNLLAEYNAGLIDIVEYHAQTKFNGNREMAAKFVAEMELSDNVRETNTIIEQYGGI